jgi:hypothetical protein
VPVIFDLLYRKYCRARLTEIRRRLFLMRTNGPEVAEANCSVSPAAVAVADDRTGGDEHHDDGDCRPR